MMGGESIIIIKQATSKRDQSSPSLTLRAIKSIYQMNKDGTADIVSFLAIFFNLGETYEVFKWSTNSSDMARFF